LQSKGHLNLVATSFENEAWCSTNARFWRKSGRHLFMPSVSQFDPEQKSYPLAGGLRCCEKMAVAL
jgi:hypothetical protein